MWKEFSYHRMLKIEPYPTKTAWDYEDDIRTYSIIDWSFYLGYQEPDVETDMAAKKAKMDKMLNDDSLPDELPTIELGKGVSAEDANQFMKRYLCFQIEDHMLYLCLFKVKIMMINYMLLKYVLRNFNSTFDSVWGNLISDLQFLI